MAKAKKKRSPAKRAGKPEAHHVYREPRTAAENKIVCAECGGAAEFFDYERAKRDHLAGFVCGKESRSARSEKLLVRAGEQSSPA